MCARCPSCAVVLPLLCSAALPTHSSFSVLRAPSPAAPLPRAVCLQNGVVINYWGSSIPYLLIKDSDISSNQAAAILVAAGSTVKKDPRSKTVTTHSTQHTDTHHVACYPNHQITGCRMESVVISNNKPQGLGIPVALRHVANLLELKDGTLVANNIGPAGLAANVVSRTLCREPPLFTHAAAVHPCCSFAWL